MPTPTCDCGTCKKCKSREYMRRWRAENSERWKELAAASYQRNRERRLQDRRAYVEKNRDKILAAEREYTKERRPQYKADPQKVKAQNAVNHAILRGDLVPQPCEGCGVAAYDTHDGRRGVHAHHDDYSKPLAVRWLCYSCHGKEHRSYA